MKRELKILHAALIYYTRIPIGKWTNNQSVDNKKNIKYFTLIGWIVGLPGAVIAFVLMLIDPSLKFLAVLFGLLTTTLLTGALHEDGLADFLDGFGGGWDKETILKIMKDSRIGTFGTLGLIGVFTAKLLAISELDPPIIPYVMIAGQTVSRTSVYLLTETLNYGGLTNNNKTQSIFNHHLSLGEIILAVCIGLAPIILNASWGSAILIVGLLLISWLFRTYINKWIGGFNGDCLGACQQLNEMFFYLQVLILCKLDLLQCKFILSDILNQM